MNSLVYPKTHQSVTSIYVQRFGQFPEGLIKFVSDRRQWKQLEQVTGEALEQNQPVNWDDFVKQLLKS